MYANFKWEMETFTETNFYARVFACRVSRTFCYFFAKYWRFWTDGAFDILEQGFQTWTFRENGRALTRLDYCCALQNRKEDTGCIFSTSPNIAEKVIATIYKQSKIDKETKLLLMDRSLDRFWAELKLKWAICFEPVNSCHSVYSANFCNGKHDLAYRTPGLNVNFQQAYRSIFLSRGEATAFCVTLNFWAKILWKIYSKIHIVIKKVNYILIMHIAHL